MPQSTQQPSRLTAEDLVIETMSIGDLVPDPTNARKHNKKQIERLAAAMAEFGFTSPVFIDEANMLIAGHARLDAARLNGLTRVPCIRFSGFGPHEKKALAIADNKLHDMSVFDPDPAPRHVG